MRGCDSVYNINDVLSLNKDLIGYIDIENDKFGSINDHSLRVCEMAVKFANAINLSEEDINQILIGSYMHDIGKIFLGKDILEGKEPLTNNQTNEVHNHPELGHGYLNLVTGLDKAKQIILLHHERIDGTGYPNGLLGFEIPIHVRLVSICDSYDAMTNYRSYSPTIHTHNEAIEELVKHKNTQFDSVLVDVFIEVFGDKQL